MKKTIFLLSLCLFVAVLAEEDKKSDLLRDLLKRVLEDKEEEQPMEKRVFEPTKREMEEAKERGIREFGEIAMSLFRKYCKNPGASCTDGGECCNLWCTRSRTCGQCRGDGSACGDAVECCSGKCQNGSCVPGPRSGLNNNQNQVGNNQNGYWLNGVFYPTG